MSEFVENSFKTTVVESDAALPSNKSLDFNIRYNSLEKLTFIQRFTAAYMFLEGIDGSGDIYCKDGITPCCGCGGGNCDKLTAVNKQASYFFLFNTMSGNSAVRCHFDGHPSEMQKWIGDTEEESYGCGSDHIVDFLFGYVGYEYHIRTDANMFKKEIMTSLTVGNPIIVKVKSGDPRFYVITGYNDNGLLCPDYRYVTYQPGKGNVLADSPEKPPAYSEIDTLYIFGNKTARRYTVKDGLMNICRVMECNINEGIWDGYLNKIGGNGKFFSDDGFDKITPMERTKRLKRLAETSRYLFNFVSFCNSICVNIPATMRDEYLYKELFGPSLSAFWEEVKVISLFDDIVGAGNQINGFCCRDWPNADPSKIREWSTEICETITKAKAADIKLLGIMKQAIKILNRTPS